MGFAEGRAARMGNAGRFFLGGLEVALVCSPLPLAGEGQGVRAGAGIPWRMTWLTRPALTPALSRKREREYPSGIGNVCSVRYFRSAAGSSPCGKFW